MIGFLVVVAFVWLIILQCQNNEIRYDLEEIRKYVITGKETVSDVVQNFGDESQNSCVENSEETPVINNDKEDTIIEKTEEKNENSFEKMFLGNIFNKIGAVAILIGFIIFIKLISPFIIFTPQLKLALGYIAGMGMMLGALKLHNKENMKSFAEVLMGTSLGTLFITTYCGYAALHLFGSITMFALAIALLIFSFFLASKFKKMSTLLISMVAAYLNPIVVNVNDGITPNFLFLYLIFVNIVSLIYVYKNKNCSPLNIVNLLLTMVYALCLFKGNNIYAPIVLWAIYLIYDFVSEEKNTVLNYLNYAVFSILSLTVFGYNYLALGLTQLNIALGYIILTCIKFKQKRDIDEFIHLVIVSINFAIYLLTKNQTDLRPYIYSIEAIILSVLSLRYNYKILANWALGAWAMGGVSIIPMQDVLYTSSLDSYIPWINKRSCMFAPLFLSALLGYITLSKSAENSIFNISQVFKFKFISILYLFVGLEINSTISKYYMESEFAYDFVRHMINVILGFIYTIQLKRIATVTKHVLFDIASAIVGIFSFIYLLCAGWDYHPLTNFIPVVNIRVLAFLTAILSFVLYSRWTKNDIYKYFGIFLGFCLIHLEIVDAIKAFDLYNFEYILSVGWILYAGIITLFGIFKEIKSFKYSGIILCLLAVIRIFIFDLANVDILYKFIAFLTLGLILMLLSYIYNKNQGNKKNNE